MKSVLAFSELMLGYLDRAVALFSGAVLLLTTVLLIVNAIARSLGYVLFAGGPTLAGLLILWLTFLGAYIPARQGRHITVDMITSRLAPAVLRWLRIVVSLIAMVLCVYAAWLGWTFTAFRFASGQIDQMLSIPAGWFYAPVPIGFALCAIAWLHAAAADLWGARK